MYTERFRGRKGKKTKDVIYHNKDLKYIVKQNESQERKSLKEYSNYLIKMKYKYQFRNNDNVM